MSTVFLPVIECERLDRHSLEAFFGDDVCALHVRGFAAGAQCNRIAEWLLEGARHDHAQQPCAGPRRLEAVGVAYQSTFGQQRHERAWQRYYAEALPGIRALRELCAPALSPIDRLRLELDELWDHSCHVANFDGQKMFVGLGQIMHAQASAEAGAHPRFEAMPPRLTQLQGQYIASLSLRMPAQGGELEIWDMDPLPVRDIAQIAQAAGDTDARAALPATSFLIRPEAGDLVFINARRAHAVRRFEAGLRISLQCFIGLDARRGLKLWS